MENKYKELFEKYYNSGNLIKELEAFLVIRKALENGDVRVAEYCGEEIGERKDENIIAGWKVNAWVKQAILWGFKLGSIKEYEGSVWSFFDKDTYPVLNLNTESGVRLVPGGSSIRSGAFLGNGVVVMPPAYINVGAYIDSGTMVDSHALVGSCAQIGKNVHLSAASQIGGVLEPVGAMPVIIEDDVFIGGNCGIYEGTIVKKNAVIGTGVILNASTAIFDATTGEYIVAEKRGNDKGQLIVPDNAVVVSGSRPISKGAGKDMGIHLYTPVIVKYRDEKTDKSISLEDLLR